MMSRPEGLRPRVAWGYVALSAVLVGAVYALPAEHVYLWGLLGLGSSAAIVVGVARNRPDHRAAWIVIALGMATFALGDITYDVLTEFMHEVNPFPSLADAFYIATYLLLATGLVLMVRARRLRDGEGGAGIDALLVTAGLGALSWIYLIQPYVDADMTWFVKVTSIAYPLGDILILCVLMRLVFGGGTRGTSVRLLVLGAVGVLSADCIYGWIQLHGVWQVGGPTDLGWVLFYVCWGAAALHPAMRDLTTQRPLRALHLSRVKLAVLSASALVAPIALVLRDVAGDKSDGGILAAVSLLVFVLVIVRLVGLAQVQSVDAGRQQTLRGFSESLVSATDRSDVWNAGLLAMMDIGAAGVIGCVVALTADRYDTIVAATWPEYVGRNVVVTTPDARSDERGLRLGGGATVGATPATTTWTQLISTERQGSQESIFVAHDRPLPVDLRAVLDDIVVQVLLALERVELTRVVVGARNERRFRAMVKYSSDVTTLLGSDMRISYQSDAVMKILGRPPEEFVGRSMDEEIHPDDILTAQTHLTKVLDGGLGVPRSSRCASNMRTDSGESSTSSSPISSTNPTSAASCSTAATSPNATLSNKNSVTRRCTTRSPGWPIARCSSIDSRTRWTAAAAKTTRWRSCSWTSTTSRR